MRSAALLLLLALAACGRDAPPAQEQPEKRQVAPSAQPDPAPAANPGGKAHDLGEGAAATLRRYYDHIESARYADAWAMRGGDPAGAAAFARNFAAYDRYKVTLGPPTEPVRAGGWAYVEVPIQIFGRVRGGDPFGSAGSVTMRRAEDVPDATAAQRKWHVYTGE
jgi:predicted small lipoprotein YifL